MASTGEAWTLGRRPALDGVRGVAILLVLLQHAGVPVSVGGGVVGVTMFFTLSGFLITALLLQERESFGSVSLAKFYWRRALRLVPALAVCVAVVTMFAAAMGPLGATFLPSMQSIGALTYTTDLMAMWNLQPYAGALNATWSLAVEEKFYLLWPLVLLLVRDRRSLVCIASAGVLLSAWLRLSGWNDGAGHTVVQYGPQAHAGSLLIGCLLALYMVGRPAGEVFPRIGLGLLALAGLCSAVAADYLRHVWLPAVVPLLVAGGLWALARSNDPYSGPLGWRPLVVLGQRSYGFYLWHWPVALLLQLLYGPGLGWPIRLAIIASASWGLTSLSWRFVEQPFLQLKDHDAHLWRRARSRDYATCVTETRAVAVRADPES